jgi:hypothetical protein
MKGRIEMPTVGPQTETQVSVVYDTDSGGFGGLLDMDGPQIGLTAYSEPGDDLHIKLTIEFGQPNTHYEVFLTGGPSHALATGFIAIGTLATNPAGSGAGAFAVPHATLLAPPFGAGYRTDHIDLLRGVGDLAKGVLTAGAINYFVCGQKGQPTPVGAPAVEAKMGAIGKGDPVGEKASHPPSTGKK